MDDEDAKCLSFNNGAGVGTGHNGTNESNFIVSEGNLVNGISAIKGHTLLDELVSAEASFDFPTMDQNKSAVVYHQGDDEDILIEKELKRIQEEEQQMLDKSRLDKSRYNQLIGIEMSFERDQQGSNDINN